MSVYNNFHAINYFKFIETETETIRSGWKNERAYNWTHIYSIIEIRIEKIGITNFFGISHVLYYFNRCCLE